VDGRTYDVIVVFLQRSSPITYFHEKFALVDTELAVQVMTPPPGAFGVAVSVYMPPSLARAILDVDNCVYVILVGSPVVLTVLEMLAEE